MKKKILIASILIFNTLAVFAYTHLEVPIELKDELGGSKILVFGVDEAATNTWDSVLGEYNAPRFPPPNGEFHAAFVIYDSLNLKELVWTYKDYRPIIDSFHFFVQYLIKVYRGDGDFLIFKWNLLPQNVDSVRITDIEEDLVLVDINLKGTKRNDTVRNRYINDFYVKVWYRNPEATVVYDYDNDNSDFIIYPVPVEGNNVSISCIKPGFTYTIITETGIELMSGRTNNDRSEINIANLQRGVYFIILNSGRSNYVKKLIRL